MLLPRHRLLSLALGIACLVGAVIMLTLRAPGQRPKQQRSVQPVHHPREMRKAA